MTQPSSPHLKADERAALLALTPPAAPQAVTVRLGVRWVQVSWQPPPTNADAPVDDYLLAVSPGSETIRFDADTTGTVLIALSPGRSYTVFVAARNDAGSSGWISSRPFELIYAAAGESEGSALLNAELFEDLLLLDDEALRDWLSTTDDLDLKLAIAAAPPAQRSRIFDCVEPVDRSGRLRQQFASPPPPEPQTAIVPYHERFQPPRPPAQPIMAQPEIVIEIPAAPRPQRRSLLWLGAAAPILILAILLISAIPRWLPQPVETHLEGTVEALVAARMTDEAAPLTQREIVVTPSPAATLPSPTVETTAAPAIYAIPAVDLLNVRSGPGEVYPVVETLPAGAQVALLARDDESDWVYISAGRVEGWVASWLLTAVDDPQTLAVRPLPPTTVASPEAPIVTSTSVTAEASPLLVAEISVEPTPSSLTAAASEATVAASADLLASPCLMGGYFWLIHPIEKTVYNQVTFHWGFSTPLPPECGFEVRIWRDGDIPRGVHDAVIDNQNGAIKSINGNEYQLDIPFLYNLPSVTGSAHYWWTVSIVQIEPTYRNFERQADPIRFYVDRIVR
ncbi:MAG: SH3 domain-containing protein [Caldilineaceae bacterium]|nr:SH3 domain-containing protein [Caldilineaceae bacterium]